MEFKVKEAELERLKQEIYDLADDGSFKFHGLNCIKTKGKASYDYKKMEKDGIDLQKYAKFGSYYYKITLDK
jgi:hypothetical protein